ncbi:MAG: YolD-like family protein [Lachnospiraceae bacterium]|nr:YolD-like family protein [Lachnospiraceae bacterium]
MKVKGRYEALAGHEGADRYADIIELPHPTSSVHPRMSLADRAAQFSPFAALTGYEDTVREAGRLTEEWVEPDEDSRAELDRKLALLQSHLQEGPEVTIAFFQPDERKEGGAYRSLSGQLTRIDPYGRILRLADGTALSMDYIVQIQSGLFDHSPEG